MTWSPRRAASIAVPSLLTAVVVALVSSAPADARPGGANGASHLGSTSASPVTQAHLAAEAEAQRLLALLTPPSGSTVETSEPGLTQPFLGSRYSNFLDYDTVWLVPLTFKQALAYVKDNPPTGLTPDGTGSSGSPSQTVDDVAYAGPDGAHWLDAGASWQVATLPHGQVGMRADGSDVWINPTPERDTQSGPRVRVRPTGRCPATLDDVSNPGQNLGHELVPPARPTGGVVCWYGGDDSGTGLHSRVVLTSLQARTIERAGRAVLIGSLGTAAPIPCPLAPYTALVALTYTHRPVVDLFWHPGACSVVDNGQITSTGIWPLAVPHYPPSGQAARVAGPAASGRA